MPKHEALKVIRTYWFEIKAADSSMSFEGRYQFIKFITAFMFRRVINA